MTRGFIRLALAGCLVGTAASCCALRGGCDAGPDTIAPPRESAFHKETVRFSGHDWPLYSIGGEGAPVLILHEIDGLSRGCLVLANELANSPEQHRVYLPLMFGKWHADAAPRHLLGFLAGRAWGKRWDLQKPDSVGTIIDEVAELCREISRRHDGKRVTVIGSCLTGSWPVALLAEPSVGGGIVCQPALPLLPRSVGAKRGLGLSEEELQMAVGAARSEDKRLLGFCYLEDAFTPEAMLMKFGRLKAAFGDRFEPWILAASEDRDQVPDGARWMEASASKGHSTLTLNTGLRSSLERPALLREAKAFLVGGD